MTFVTENGLNKGRTGRVFRFLFPLVCLLAAASSADALTVQLDAFDLDQDAVSGVRVEIAGVTSGFFDLPTTAEADAGLYDFEVEVNGIPVNLATLSLEIKEAFTRTYNPVDGGLIKNKFSGADTRVYFQFDIRSVDLGAIDVKDLDVSGVTVQFVDPDLGTVSIPNTVKLPTSGAEVNVFLGGSQVNGSSFTVTANQAFTRRYQAEDGNFNGQNFSGAVTKIVFEIAILSVDLDAEDVKGAALAGVSVDFVDPDFGELTLPTTLSLPLSGAEVNVLLNGQQVNGPSFTIVPQEAFTRSYQAEDGSFNGGEFSSAVTKIIFDHNVLDVSFTGIDANGDPLSGTSFEFGTEGGTVVPPP